MLLSQSATALNRTVSSKSKLKQFFQKGGKSLDFGGTMLNSAADVDKYFKTDEDVAAAGVSNRLNNGCSNSSISK